jgi:hypothetical protein
MWENIETVGKTFQEIMEYESKLVEEEEPEKITEDNSMFKDTDKSSEYKDTVITQLKQAEFKSVEDLVFSEPDLAASILHDLLKEAR